MRNRFMIYDLRFMIFIIIFAIFINHQSLFVNRVFAVDSTNSASSAADIKSKLRILQEEIASKAAEMKSEVTRKLQNKAYVGTLKSKNDNLLVLSVKGNFKNININEFTEYIIKSKTYIGEAGLKNITTDTTIACLGDIDDKGTLTAKRIVKLNSPVPVFPKIVHGIITSMSDKKAKLETLQKDRFLIAFDKNTLYKIGKTEGELDDIRIRKWVIVSGQATSSATPSAYLEEIQADYVYIFPNAKLAKPKITTPSATP